MDKTIGGVVSCVNCQKAGLAILPVRYAVVPTTMPGILPAGMTGPGVLDVPLTMHRYSLRTLREGWVYVFYEQGARGKHYWEAYQVTADGLLWRVGEPPLPPEPKIDMACAAHSVAVPMALLVIERPEKATKVYVAFSEHAWVDDTFKQYASNAKIRSERMQMIKPSSWITSGDGSFGGSKGEHGHAVAATTAGIETVVEYHPGIDPKKLQPSAPVFNADADGVVKDSNVWRQESTRYPLHMRQTSTVSVSAETLKLMEHIGHRPSGKPYTPMLLGLWDGIGITHELNGFSNDPAGVLMQYASSQAKRVDAMQLIDGAEAAVRTGAASSKSQWRKTWMTMALTGGGADDPMALLRPGAQEMINDAGKLTPAEVKEAGDSAWKDYVSYLKDKAWPNNFKKGFDNASTECTDIQSKRAVDVDMWIKSDLLSYTMCDYDQADVNDGLAYADVVATAFAGLQGTAVGQNTLEAQLSNMNVDDSKCYCWRAFAYNQKETLSGLGHVLAAAKDATAWTEEHQQKLSTVLAYVKSFAKLYEKMEEVATHATTISATEKAVRAMRVDKWMVAVGRVIVKIFGPISNAFGGAVIKATFLVRVGFSTTDAAKVVAGLTEWNQGLSANLEKYEKAAIAKGTPVLEARTVALEQLSRENKSQIVQAMFVDAERNANESAAKAITAQKLYGTLLVIELLNFYVIAMKPHKSGADYMTVGSGVLSLVGACLNVPNKWLGAFAKTAAVTTLANMKVAASYLSGVGGFLSFTIDINKTFNNFSDGNIVQGILYAAKSGSDAASGISYVLTAMSSSASLLARGTFVDAQGVTRVRYLGKVALGLIGNQARAAQLASGATKKVALEEGSAAAGRALVAAGAVAAEEIGSKAAFMMMGRVLLIASGWEVAVLLLVIQVGLNYFLPNDLQNWISRSVFGKSPWAEWDLEKQRAEFHKAMVSEGFENDTK
ncbi:T6SS effector BTH_I2691 family protein (plasmid) [Robbsia andropogonis]|uniref:T6SS effector BTH_I2691 family protein n=1 Tax=Robbsia andropogonis TaxID=28092 RepID=UPI003D221D6C